MLLSVLDDASDHQRATNGSENDLNVVIPDEAGRVELAPIRHCAEQAADGYDQQNDSDDHQPQGITWSGDPMPGPRRLGGQGVSCGGDHGVPP
jgi:hypothetical protein